ncbi:hypothetical protein NO1_1828 [Candidatus Termititenax aidoneus]|uniref:Uncharacterized protein n=1 Tax=Termititenax aidoneus TaxID=2218524 RepID=A0A388TCS4_TERA1|nr:hypothetical protein NO1_1828 [Candidatus Termititenax aidoneus]
MTYEVVNTEKNQVVKQFYGMEACYLAASYANDLNEIEQTDKYDFCRA